jgi:hypothetical protein
VGDPAPKVDIVARREKLPRVVIIVQSQPELPQIALALRPPGRLPSGLHCGQQQSDQGADNGDHDKELSKRKTATTSHDAYSIPV